MALRVIQPSEVYTKDHLVGCIYGPPGLLKSTLANTAKNPILLDFDEGIHRAEFRRAFVPVPSWKDVSAMERTDFEPYNTAIVDTAGRALDKLSAYIIEKNPKMANPSGGLSLQGFGVLKVEFATFLNKLKSYGLDILLVVHMQEEKRGDEIVERLDAQGASRQEIYKSADFMGRLSSEPDGTISLNFTPSPTGFGKNPGHLPVMKFTVPISPAARYIETVFEKTKERINALTEEQRVVSAALEAWRDRVNQANSAEELTALIAQVPTDVRVQESAKKVLNSIANDKGYRYDKDKSAFVTKTNGTVAQLPAPQAAQEPQKAPEPTEAPATAQSAPQGEREPGEEGPDEPRPQTSNDEKRARLQSLFAIKYPEPADLMKAFKQADATCFFKGKLRGARSSPADLSDMDVAIMLHAIDTNQLSI